jgi:hypothetical protein
MVSMAVMSSTLASVTAVTVRVFVVQGQLINTPDAEVVLGTISNVILVASVGIGAEEVEFSRQVRVGNNGGDERTKRLTIIASLTAASLLLASLSSGSSDPFPGGRFGGAVMMKTLSRCSCLGQRCGCGTDLPTGFVVKTMKRVYAPGWFGKRKS